MMEEAVIAVDAEDVVGGLVAQGVELSVADGDILYTGPAEALGEDALEGLRVLKPKVVGLLERNCARGVVRLGPTSLEQQRMGWRSRSDTNAASYNVCMRVDFCGDLDVRRLSATIDKLATRHEILRSRFSRYGDHLLQEVLAPGRGLLQVLEPHALAGLSDAEVARWCSRRGSAAFNLAMEAPARWCLAPLSGGRAVLLMTFHHIACDGWSIDRLLAELARLYELEELVAEPPSCTPFDFAGWERGWLTETRVNDARAFFSDELRGAALSPTFLRTERPTRPGGDSGAVVRHISEDLVASVQGLACAIAVSELSVYFAAFALLLAEETREGDCAAVIAVLNRTRPEHELVIGLTRNAQAIRCSVAKEDTLASAALQMSTRVERASVFQWFPISLLLDPTARREIDARCLPVTFAFAAAADDTLDLGNVRASVKDVFLGAARAGLSLFVRRRGQIAEAFFEYAKDHIDEVVVGPIADRYLAIVAQAADVALAEVP